MEKKLISYVQSLFGTSEETAQKIVAGGALVTVLVVGLFIAQSFKSPPPDPVFDFEADAAAMTENARLQSNN